MKIHVNDTAYDVKNIGERVWLNKNEITIRLSDDEIIINGHTFYIDFIEQGDPSLVILNGMTYLVSKNSSKTESIKEIKIPMRGKITDVLVRSGMELKEGDVIAILQAMKMDNQIKSPRSGRINKSKSRKTSLSRRETFLSHSNEEVSILRRPVPLRLLLLVPSPLLPHALGTGTIDITSAYISVLILNLNDNPLLMLIS
jgi:glycine cleavage system H lipoate-binding protein